MPKYMRAFAAAWPDRKIVQDALARITWYHHIALLEKLDNPHTRLWYAQRVRETGWSHNVLILQIEETHRRRRVAYPAGRVSAQTPARPVTDRRGDRSRTAGRSTMSKTTCFSLERKK